MRSEASTAAHHGPRRTVVGTGLVALDVVIPDDLASPARVQAGGTCGNVLAALAYLAWDAYPLARLGQDGPMRRVCQDFTQWGVKLDFLSRHEQDGTPVITQYIRRVRGGTTHSFSWRCPSCGADMPRYKPLRITDLEPLLPQLPSPDVFFFDRVAAATIRLAGHFRDLGALVVFEPSGVGDPRLFREAISAAHVVKYSCDRIGDSAGIEDIEGPTLLIETTGDEGLRYLFRSQKAKSRRWRTITAIPAPTLLDTAGCGDWCTAGLLHRLPGGGADGLLNSPDGVILEAIRYGQALAAWNCGFEGARGGMYDVSRADFELMIDSLLAGRVSYDHTARSPVSREESPKPFSCSACPPDAANVQSAQRRS